MIELHLDSIAVSVFVVILVGFDKYRISDKQVVIEGYLMQVESVVGCSPIEGPVGQGRV